MDSVYISDGFTSRFIGLSALHQDASKSPSPGGLLRGSAHRISVITTWQRRVTSMAPGISLEGPSGPAGPRGTWTTRLVLCGATLDLLHLACLMSTAIVVRVNPGEHLEDIATDMQRSWPRAAGGSPDVYLLYDDPEDVTAARRAVSGGGSLVFPCRRVRVASSMSGIHVRSFSVCGVRASPRQWVGLVSGLGPHRSWPPIATDACRRALEGAVTRLKETLTATTTVEYEDACDGEAARLSEGISLFAGVGTTVHETCDAFARASQEMCNAHYAAVSAVIRDGNESAMRRALAPCEGMLKNAKYGTWEDWAGAVAVAITTFQEEACGSRQRDAILLDALVQWVVPNCGVVCGTLLKRCEKEVVISTPERVAAMEASHTLHADATKRKVLTAFLGKEDDAAAALAKDLHAATAATTRALREMETEAARHKVTAARLAACEKERDRLRLEGLRRCATTPAAVITTPPHPPRRRMSNVALLANDSDDDENDDDEIARELQMEVRALKGMSKLISMESEGRSEVCLEEGESMVEAAAAAHASLARAVRLWQNEAVSLQGLVDGVGQSFDAMTTRLQQRPTVLATPAVSNVSIETSTMRSVSPQQNVTTTSSASHNRTFSASGAVLRKPRLLH